MVHSKSCLSLKSPRAQIFINYYFHSHLKPPYMNRYFSQVDTELISHTNYRSALIKIVDEELKRHKASSVALFFSGGLDSSILFWILRELGCRPTILMIPDDGSYESACAHKQLRKYGLTALYLPHSEKPISDFINLSKFFQRPIFNLRAIEKIRLLTWAKSLSSFDLCFSGFGADEAFLLDPLKMGESLAPWREEVVFFQKCGLFNYLPSCEELNSPLAYHSLIWSSLSLSLEMDLAKKIELNVAYPFLDPLFSQLARQFWQNSDDDPKISLRKEFKPLLGEEVAMQKKIPVFSLSPLIGPSQSQWYEFWEKERPLENLFSDELDFAYKIKSEWIKLEQSSSLYNRLFLKFLSTSLYTSQDDGNFLNC